MVGTEFFEAYGLGWRLTHHSCYPEDYGFNRARGFLIHGSLSNTKNFQTSAMIVVDWGMRVISVNIFLKKRALPLVVAPVIVSSGGPLKRSNGRLSGDAKLPVSCLVAVEIIQAVKWSLKRRCEAPSIFTVTLQNFSDLVFTA
ncbi:hypothetical protein ACSBR2_008480 [Camellia fascicularis]